MNKVIYQVNHSKSGNMHFELDSPKKSVRFACDWPYDLATNEWMSPTMEFALRDFINQIKRLSRRKRVIVPGTHGGSITLTRLNSTAIEVRLVGENTSSREEWHFCIPARPHDLLPHRD